MYSLHWWRGNLRQRTERILPGPAMGSQLCWSQQRGPSCLAWAKSVVLLEGFAPPECLCSFHGRSVSLMEPEPSFFFLFPPPPTHALIAHWPPEIPTSIREGTSWNVPPREHQRNNCPGGIGLMASELLQPELCTPVSGGYPQIVCAHGCILNMCLTRGFDQGGAEIHQQASCHFKFMVCTIKTGRVVFFLLLLFLNPLGSHIFLGLGDLEWKCFVLTFFFSFSCCALQLCFSHQGIEYSDGGGW